MSANWTKTLTKPNLQLPRKWNWLKALSYSMMGPPNWFIVTNNNIIPPTIKMINCYTVVVWWLIWVLRRRNEAVKKSIEMGLYSITCSVGGNASQHRNKHSRHAPQELDDYEMIRLFSTTVLCINTVIFKHICHELFSTSLKYTLGKKGCYTPGWCLFLWLFLFHQSARSKERLFGVIQCFLCIWCPIFLFCCVLSVLTTFDDRMSNWPNVHT